MFTPSKVLAHFRQKAEELADGSINQLEGFFVEYAKRPARNNYYYDKLRDELTEDQMKIMIPPTVRKLLEHDIFYLFSGNIVTQTSFFGDNLHTDYLFKVDKVVKCDKDRQAQQDIERQRVISDRKKKPYVDVQALLIDKLIKKQKPRIALIYSEHGIVDSDFKAAIAAVGEYYNVKGFAVTFQRVDDFIKAIEYVDGKFDVVAVMRGGGGSFDTFNDLVVLRRCSNMRSALVTAIGHNEDNTCLDVIADLSCPTPTALGAFLNHIVTQIAHESNLKMTKQQLEKAQKQIDTLKKKKPSRVIVLALSGLVIILLIIILCLIGHFI